MIVEPVAANMGVVVPEKGFLQGLRQHLRPVRRSADSGRSHYRISSAAGRCCRTLWCHTGSGDLWQDHRRRHAGRCIRRQTGDHAAGGSAGLCLPGGYAQRQSGGNACRSDTAAVFAGTSGSLSSGRLPVPPASQRSGRHYSPAPCATCTVNGIGSLSCLYFTPEPVRNYADAKKADTARVPGVFSLHAGSGQLFRSQPV